MVGCIIDWDSAYATAEVGSLCNGVSKVGGAVANDPQNIPFIYSLKSKQNIYWYLFVQEQCSLTLSGPYGGW